MSSRANVPDHGPRIKAFARCLLLAVLLPASSAGAQELVVKFDQSQLLRLPRPVAEIVIGNPSIADVTVQSGNLALRRFKWVA